MISFDEVESTTWRALELALKYPDVVSGWMTFRDDAWTAPTTCDLHRMHRACLMKRREGFLAEFAELVQLIGSLGTSQLSFLRESLRLIVEGGASPCENRAWTDIAETAFGN